MKAGTGTHICLISVIFLIYISFYFFLYFITFSTQESTALVLYEVCLQLQTLRV